MPDYFEQGFFVREPAWHGLGTVIEHAPNMYEARKLSGWGMDNYSLRSVAYSKSKPDGENSMVLAKDYKMIVRDRDQNPYSIVSSGFVIVQPKEIFEIAKILLGEGCVAETAISLKDGAIVSLLVKLPSNIKIAGEEIKPYLLITTAFDATMATRIKFTNTRVVCWNTLQMALAGKRMKNEIALKHTGDPLERLKRVKHVLGIGFEYEKQFQKTAEQLLSESFTYQEYTDLCRTLLPEPEADVTDRKRLNWAMELEVMVREWKAPDLGNVIGTKWAALNAVAAYVDHHSDFRGDKLKKAESRFIKSIYDLGGLKELSSSILMGL